MSVPAEVRVRRAALVEWRCERCRKLLGRIDPDRPCYVAILCDRCRHDNVWVEAYTSSR